jgi:hypothetical protein
LRIAGIASQKEEALLEIANVDSHVAIRTIPAIRLPGGVDAGKAAKACQRPTRPRARINDLTDVKSRDSPIHKNICAIS